MYPSPGRSARVNATAGSRWRWLYGGGASPCGTVSSKKSGGLYRSAGISRDSESKIVLQLGCTAAKDSPNERVGGNTDSEGPPTTSLNGSLPVNRKTHGSIRYQNCWQVEMVRFKVLFCSTLLSPMLLLNQQTRTAGSSSSSSQPPLRQPPLLPPRQYRERTYSTH